MTLVNGIAALRAAGSCNAILRRSIFRGKGTGGGGYSFLAAPEGAMSQGPFGLLFWPSGVSGRSAARFFESDVLADDWEVAPILEVISEKGGAE